MTTATGMNSRRGSPSPAGVSAATKLLFMPSLSVTLLSERLAQVLHSGSAGGDDGTWRLQRVTADSHHGRVQS